MGNLIWPVLGALAYCIAGAHVVAPKMMPCMQRLWAAPIYLCE